MTNRYRIASTVIVLMVALIYSRRDTGPMLIAERKTQVYQRTDGGDGRGKGGELEGKGKNQPREDQPAKSWNFVFPVLILVRLLIARRYCISLSFVLF